MRGTAEFVDPRLYLPIMICADREPEEYLDWASRLCAQWMAEDGLIALGRPGLVLFYGMVGDCAEYAGQEYLAARARLAYEHWVRTDRAIARSN